mgnify:CR=1 FL=1
MTAPRKPKITIVDDDRDTREMLTLALELEDLLGAKRIDLIVLPEVQRQGIGGEILDRLVKRCQEAHIRDIQLFCASGKRAFYERHGFVARPDDAPGMQYRIG